MKLDKYQDKIYEIFGNMDKTETMFWLGEEAGEVLKVYKVSIKDNVPIIVDNLVEEIGDVLVTLALIAQQNGLSLDDIGGESIDKWKQKIKEKSLSYVPV